MEAADCVGIRPHGGTCAWDLQKLVELKATGVTTPLVRRVRSRAVESVIS
jgi:hypothetical protein